MCRSNIILAVAGATEPEQPWPHVVLGTFHKRATVLAAFLYRCPATKQTVQGFIAEELSDPNAYEAVECLACRRMHFVNPATGKVLGEDDE